MYMSIYKILKAFRVQETVSENMGHSNGMVILCITKYYQIFLILVLQTYTVITSKTDVNISRKLAEFKSISKYTMYCNS